MSIIIGLVMIVHRSIVAKPKLKCLFSLMLQCITTAVSIDEGLFYTTQQARMQNGRPILTVTSMITSNEALGHAPPPEVSFDYYNVL